MDPPDSLKLFELSVKATEEDRHVAPSASATHSQIVMRGLAEDFLSRPAMATGRPDDTPSQEEGKSLRWLSDYEHRQEEALVALEARLGSRLALLEAKLDELLRRTERAPSAAGDSYVDFRAGTDPRTSQRYHEFKAHVQEFNELSFS